MISFTNHLELEFQRSVLCKSNNLDEMHDFRSLSLRSFLESAKKSFHHWLWLFKRHSEIVWDYVRLLACVRKSTKQLVMWRIWKVSDINTNCIRYYYYYYYYYYFLYFLFCNYSPLHLKICTHHQFLWSARKIPEWEESLKRRQFNGALISQEKEMYERYYNFCKSDFPKLKFPFGRQGNLIWWWIGIARNNNFKN